MTTALSPTVSQTARRAVPWVVLGAIAVLIALAGLLLTGGRTSSGTPLDAGNAGPVGGKALAQVLRQQGVEVTAAGSFDEARDAAGGGAAEGVTVLVFDGGGNLPPESYDRLATAASSLVVVEPTFQTLQHIAPDVRAAGAPDGAASAGCDLAAARRAERIDARPTPDTQGSSVPGTFEASGDAVACFTDDAGGASVVRTTFEGADVTLVGSAALLMNDGITRAGNAALGLNLLGEHRALVWYLPGLLDRPVTGPPDLAALTPGWVTPVLLLLLLVFVAAAIWRGRRFGPLVVENLPVVVRAGETREGRARLYQRSSARLRAADALRIGAIGRLAATAGLPRAATTTEVIAAVAALTGRDPQHLARLLVDDVPGSDHELIALSDALAELERAASREAMPAAAPPARGRTASAGQTGRMEP